MKLQPVNIYWGWLTDTFGLLHHSLYFYKCLKYSTLSIHCQSIQTNSGITGLTEQDFKKAAIVFKGKKDEQNDGEKMVKHKKEMKTTNGKQHLNEKSTG